MTYKDYLEKEHPKALSSHYCGEVFGCPGDWFEGAATPHSSSLCHQTNTCADCWLQQYHGETLRPDHPTP